MDIYHTTYKDTITRAEASKKRNYNTYTERGMAQCDCGESYAISVIDMDTLNILERHVFCEACHNNY